MRPLTSSTERGRALVDNAFADHPELIEAGAAVVSRLATLKRETLTDEDASWLARHRRSAAQSGAVVALSPVAALERAGLLVRSPGHDSSWVLAAGVSLDYLLYRAWSARWPGLPVVSLRELLRQEAEEPVSVAALGFIFAEFLDSGRAEDWAALVSGDACPSSVSGVAADVWATGAAALETRSEEPGDVLVVTGPGAVVKALVAVGDEAAARQLVAFHDALAATPRREWSRLALTAAKGILDRLDDGSDQDVVVVRARVCEALLGVLTRAENELRVEVARTALELETGLAQIDGGSWLQLVVVGASNNLGITLREAGRLDEALAVFERALSEIPSPLALGDIATMRTALAALHNNYGTTLSHAERHEEALVEQRRGLEIAEAAIAAGDDARAQAAGCNYNLALSLKALERQEEALEALAAARADLEALVAEGDAAQREPLARACYVLGTSLDKLGRYDDARAALEEAWRLAETLYFAEGRTEHRWLVTGVVPRLSELLCDVDREPEARELVGRWIEAAYDGMDADDKA